ncbi:MAG: HAD family phosphatase [Anaerolineae bacterium]|nr:HAD family phosphatase [Anaerolineae bacterium]
MHNSNGRLQAVVFDLGGVLIDWDPRYLYRKLFGNDEQAVERFLQEINFIEWNQRQDAGRPFKEAVEEACQRYPQHCELIRAYDARYPESISGPIWETVEILRAIKQAGYPIYALSNWPSEKWQLVRPKFEFFNWFDEIMISGEVRLAKPDPQIFRLLLDRIGHAPGECLYIDDHAPNIVVAEQLGFHTHHFETPEKLQAELKSLGVLA